MLGYEAAQLGMIDVEQQRFRVQSVQVVNLLGAPDESEDLVAQEAPHDQLPDVVEQAQP